MVWLNNLGFDPYGTTTRAVDALFTQGKRDLGNGFLVVRVGDDALPDPCSGLIRREDVRPIDASAPVEVYRSFRPGDIVLARVLSLGDARAYYLSTSEVALGVVLARSSEGAVLRPVSHCLMECPKTKNREPRKVAKPAAPPPAEPETAAAEPAET